jgi:hypothetical protein
MPSRCAAVSVALALQPGRMLTIDRRKLLAYRIVTIRCIAAIAA